MTPASLTAWRKEMTRKERSRIIHELANMSRDGWANARPEDYKPLEDKLREASK